MLEQLTTYLRQQAARGLCVAFSGGVDSAVVLKLACAASRRPVHAVTFHTQLHPASDLALARRLAAEYGARHTVIEIDEFADPRIMQNPPERCYLCKRLLFTALREYAQQEGLGCLLDGTNADDLTAYRPGLRALSELGVLSPLAELGVCKAQVRQLAQQLGIAVAQRPSAPCLATRLPYGAPITRALLERIDRGEELLKSLGFAVVRLRLHGDVLRIEVPKEALARLLAQAETVVQGLKALGFVYITLDLEGFRSGSMDILLPQAQGMCEKKGKGNER